MEQPRKATKSVTVEFMELAGKCNIIPLCQELGLDNSDLTVNLDTYPLRLEFRFPGADESERSPVASPSTSPDVPTDNPCARTDDEGKPAPDTQRSLTVGDDVSNETSEHQLHSQGHPIQSEPREQRAFEALMKQGSKEWESYVHGANFQVNLPFEPIAAWLARNVQQTIKRMEDVVDVDKRLFRFLPKSKENCDESVHCSHTFNKIYLKDTDQAMAENVDVAVIGKVFREVQKTPKSLSSVFRNDVAAITYRVFLDITFTLISCDLCQLKGEHNLMSMQELCKKFIWQ